MYVKNLANQFIGFCLVNASDGSALIGATVTAVRSVDGGAQAACTGTVSEKGGGQYVLALSQADVNGNDISYLFTATGAVPVEKTIVTVVSAALGYVGIDWASINAPTTAQGLSGTTIATSQVVASVTGSVGSVVGLTASNLDATVSSRLASASYTAPDNAGIAAIQAKTDQLTFGAGSSVACNVLYVHNVEVKGVGTVADPWNPV